MPAFLKSTNKRVNSLTLCWVSYVSFHLQSISKNHLSTISHLLLTLWSNTMRLRPPPCSVTPEAKTFSLSNPTSLSGLTFLAFLWHPVLLTTLFSLKHSWFQCNQFLPSTLLLLSLMSFECDFSWDSTFAPIFFSSLCSPQMLPRHPLPALLPIY